MQLSSAYLEFSCVQRTQKTPSESNYHMGLDYSSLTCDRGVSLVEFTKILESDWAAAIVCTTFPNPSSPSEWVAPPDSVYLVCSI